MESELNDIITKGLSVGLFTMFRKGGWICQISDDKGRRFTSAEGKTMQEAFLGAKEKMDKLWVTE